MANGAQDCLEDATHTYRHAKCEPAKHFPSLMYQYIRSSMEQNRRHVYKPLLKCFTRSQFTSYRALGSN
jgi:hypothetical protein